MNVTDRHDSQFCQDERPASPSRRAAIQGIELRLKL